MRPQRAPDQEAGVSGGHHPVEPGKELVGADLAAPETDVAVRAHGDQSAPRPARHPVDADHRAQRHPVEAVTFPLQQHVHPGPCRQVVQSDPPAGAGHVLVPQPVPRPRPIARWCAVDRDGAVPVPDPSLGQDAHDLGHEETLPEQHRHGGAT